ncbi:MAG: glycoside hydrolase family 9 protein [Candidatus Hydrogenedentes bacterium]|nr:glycoside hydrolase family 9 protein [Candidatus Hydrogenedentota bacterium]
MPLRYCLMIAPLFLFLLSAPGVWALSAGVQQHDGIDDLLLLTSRCVILVVNPQDEIAAEIDRLSGGEFSAALAAWKRSKDAGGKPNWAAYHTAIQNRESHIAEARTQIREERFQDPAEYLVASDGAPGYDKPLSPLRAAVMPVSLGADSQLGHTQIDFALYCYLELPAPMTNGHTYTFSVSKTRSLSFKYGEDTTVSRAIKVNQLGYLPDAPLKYAYFGACLYGLGPLDGSPYTAFEVRDTATHATVFSGPVLLRSKNKAFEEGGRRKPVNGDLLETGEDVYELDLKELKQPGNYYVYIPGAGRSWPFRVAEDVYGEAFYTSARGLYHQRCNIALENPYTQWPRKRCHTEPVYECEHIGFGLGDFARPKDYKVFDVVAGSIDTSRKTEEVIGGWHDAADWDRNTRHFTDIFDLLYVYELMPGKFADGQLHIPESGNGIPDILDEAHYGMEVWTRSMTPEGGVSGFVETWTHPEMDAPVKYAFALRTRWNSLDYAAAAAMLAQHLAPFDPKLAGRYRENAIKAWKFGVDPKNRLDRVALHAKEERGQGNPYTLEWTEPETCTVPYQIHAAMRLYLLTEDKTYAEGLAGLMKAAPPLYKHPFTFQDYSPWFYFSLVQKGGELAPKFTLAEFEKEMYIKTADKLVEWLPNMAYRSTWEAKEATYLGLGLSCVTNRNRALLAAFALTGNGKYREAAILNTDFMFGANALGMSWTTGIGSVYPVSIQHAVSEEDGIDDPVPGITIFGITAGVNAQLKNEVWKSPLGHKQKEYKTFYTPNIPVWRNWSAHPRYNVAQCEFTIYETMSSTILSTAWLMSEGWQPDAALKRRAPKPKEQLHGYYYLP